MASLCGEDALETYALWYSLVSIKLGLGFWVGQGESVYGHFP